VPYSVNFSIFYAQKNSFPSRKTWKYTLTVIFILGEANYAKIKCWVSNYENPAIIPFAWENYFKLLNFAFDEIIIDDKKIHDRFPFTGFRFFLNTGLLYSNFDYDFLSTNQNYLKDKDKKINFSEPNLQRVASFFFVEQVPEPHTYDSIFKFPKYLSEYCTYICKYSYMSRSWNMRHYCGKSIN
jgi:hypothetical protein